MAIDSEKAQEWLDWTLANWEQISFRDPVNEYVATWLTELIGDQSQEELIAKANKAMAMLNAEPVEGE